MSTNIEWKYIQEFRQLHFNVDRIDEQNKCKKNQLDGQIREVQIKLCFDIFIIFGYLIQKKYSIPI